MIGGPLPSVLREECAISKSISGDRAARLPDVFGTGAPSSSKSRAFLAWSLWLLTLGEGLATLWVVFTTDFLQLVGGVNAVVPTPDELFVIRALVIAIFAITMGYASVGVLLAGRGRAGRIAALLLGGGALFALIPFGYMVGGSLIIREPDSALFSVLLLLGPVAIGPGYLTILPGLAIFFPDGNLPSRRWRRPVGVFVASVGVGTFLQLVRPGPLVGGPGSGTRNPFGLAELPAAVGAAADIAVAVGILGVTVLGIAAVIARYLRGDPSERQQQRWFLASVSLAAVPLALSAVTAGSGGPLLALVAAAGLILVPISVGIAVTRYRLYEIDHLISRTLVYVPLTAVLAGLYAATLALLHRVFESLTGDTSDAAVIVSTLILAAVFTPLRKWLDAIVDRRFKPIPAAIPDAPVASSGDGAPEWEARVAAVALRVVRDELAGRPVSAVPVEPSEPIG